VIKHRHYSSRYSFILKKGCLSRGDAIVVYVIMLKVPHAAKKIRESLKYFQG